MKQAPGNKKSATRPEVWVDLYGDHLYRYAVSRVRNRAVAEDLVQETFLAALAGGNSFAGRSSEKTWLTGILRHKIVDHFRRAARRRIDDARGDEEVLDRLFHQDGSWKEKPTAWDISPEQTLQNKQFWSTLWSCLEELSERARIAFTLREMEGLGCEDICKVMDISASNCWVILYRARMALRHCLGVNWFGGKNESLDV